MSTPEPTRPPRRRRIAGERRPRPDAASPEPVPARAPSRQPGAGPATPRLRASTTVARADGPVPGAPRDAPRDAPGPRGRDRDWRTPFAAAAVAFVVLVSAALWLGLGTWDYREVRQAEAVQSTRQSASAAAERAALAILSYDHTSLDSDLRAAQRFMTPAFAEQYTDTFDTFVRENATRLKATVRADVLATGVVSASRTEAEVLVFVDQTTTSTANEEPQVALNRTTFKMVERDGSWLVDDIKSY